MGNLRQKYTDEEWDEIGKRPSPKIILSLSIIGKELPFLKKLRKKLVKMGYNDYDLKALDHNISIKKGRA